jgi:hypothetical protein
MILDDIAIFVINYAPIIDYIVDTFIMIRDAIRHMFLFYGNEDDFIVKPLAIR